MSLPPAIKSDHWIKNWSGNWHTQFASLYRVYTAGLKPYVGKNLQATLLVCEKRVSSNYIAEKDLDAYGHYIASLVMADIKLGTKWANDTLKTAQVLLTAIKRIKSSQSFTAESLLDLRQKFYLHIPPHFSIKKLVDYLPENLQKRLMPRLKEVRIKTENLFNTVDNCLRLYTKFIAKKAGYPETLTEFLTVEEILSYLRQGKIMSKSDLKKRSNGIAIFFREGKHTILAGADFENLLRVLVDKSVTKLKGTAAYLGKARGTVRIIFDPRQAKVFNRGDVLVTGMTRPEFLPLMKKAAAFVTDAGGMLSHAAIVARELSKPCVIGTQIATKIFKDGDRVEVDATKGMVKKL